MVKASAVSALTQAINQLKAFLVCGDPQLRERLEPLRDPALFAACAELNPQHGVVHQALQLLAVRIRHLSEQITPLKKQITLTIRALNSDLLKVFGVGPDSAAALLIAAGENHNRLTSEASFAALCGQPAAVHQRVSPAKYRAALRRMPRFFFQFTDPLSGSAQIRLNAVTARLRSGQQCGVGARTGPSAAQIQFRSVSVFTQRSPVTDLIVAPGRDRYNATASP